MHAPTTDTLLPCTLVWTTHLAHGQPTLWSCNILHPKQFGHRSLCTFEPYTTRLSHDLVKKLSALNLFDPHQCTPPTVSAPTSSVFSTTASPA